MTQNPRPMAQPMKAQGSEAPTTGWPASELMQDDCRPLSKWLSTRPDSRLHAREAAAAIARDGDGSPARSGARPDEKNLPRIKRHNGVWHCYLKGSGQFHVLCGLGRTPVQAWIDWKILSNKYPETQADSCVQLKG